MALMWNKLVILASAIVGPLLALDNGLARTPPMGWMSWAKFECELDCLNHPLRCISENLYMDMGAVMAAEGYLAAGYEYVHIDDCWMNTKRTAAGKLTANETRFPHGIASLADYLHQRGLKLGIYEDLGNITCGLYPGSLLHLKDDADTFAAWKVDYLKFDGCFVNESYLDIGYPEMGKYLLETGQPMVYSCIWPKTQIEMGKKPNYTLIAEHCNQWRTFGDVNLELGWRAIEIIIDFVDHNQDQLASVQGPGRWNDPDMIIVGNAEQLSVAQAESQMALWSIWSAPLIMSNDLRSIPPEHKRILLNSKVIAVDQDPLGIMGKLVLNTTNLGIYAKPMTPVKVNGNHSYAIAVFNRNHQSTAKLSLTIARLGLVNELGYFVENLFTDEQLGWMAPDGVLTSTVKPTGVAFYKATVA